MAAKPAGSDPDGGVDRGAKLMGGGRRAVLSIHYMKSTRDFYSHCVVEAVRGPVSLRPGYNPKNADVGYIRVYWLGANLSDEDMVKAEQMAVIRLAAEQGGFGRVWARQSSASCPFARRQLCSRCGRDDHTTRFCLAEFDVLGTPLKERIRPVGGDNWAGGCARCGMTTHLASDCYGFGASALM